MVCKDLLSPTAIPAVKMGLHWWTSDSLPDEIPLRWLTLHLPVRLGNRGQRRRGCHARCCIPPLPLCFLSRSRSARTSPTRRSSQVAATFYMDEALLVRASNSNSMSRPIGALAKNKASSPGIEGSGGGGALCALYSGCRGHGCVCGSCQHDSAAFPRAAPHLATRGRQERGNPHNREWEINAYAPRLRTCTQPTQLFAA